MPFFNFIYQTYSQDHRQILLLGGAIYLAFYTGIYSGYLPINCFDDNITKLFKQYGWVLAIIDYITLNLLHYFQTGTYLIESGKSSTRVPRYISLEDDEEDYPDYKDNNQQIPVQVGTQQDQTQIPTQPITPMAPPTATIGPQLGQGPMGNVNNSSPPFDPNYNLSDEQFPEDESEGITSVGDDENYFNDQQSVPRIVDNYALQHSDNEE